MKENDDPADEEMDDSDTVGTCDHSAMSIAISAPDNTRPIKVMSTFPHDLGDGSVAKKSGKQLGGSRPGMFAAFNASEKQNGRRSVLRAVTAGFERFKEDFRIW